MSLVAFRSALSPAGRTFALTYLLVAGTANLVWEAAQLPLYTIWKTAPMGELAYAAIHCTIGDLMILAAALLLALLLAGDGAWPKCGFARVALVTTALGVAFTIFSEWLNVEILRNWAYAKAMPLVPPLETGLSPFLQWVLVPPLVLCAMRPLRIRSVPG